MSSRNKMDSEKYVFSEEEDDGDDEDSNDTDHEKNELPQPAYIYIFHPKIMKNKVFMQHMIVSVHLGLIRLAFIFKIYIQRFIANRQVCKTLTETTAIKT